MNLGFLGLQFSFGLQQGNMGPIYSYLGAEESKLILLSIAGPVTGLVVQPLVGALSDRNASRWGRRTPFLVLGAVLCFFGLISMPFSVSIAMAVSLLWIIDAGNNMTMEPYRAYVSDRLRPSQQNAGFLTQSAFTGLAQMLAFLSPSVFVYLLGVDKDAVDANGVPLFTQLAFITGAFLSLSTILWSVYRVRELPLSDERLAYLASQSKSIQALLKEIWGAILAMPMAMRKLALMSIFQWYAMASYWGYVIYSIGRSVFHTSDPGSSAFRDAVLTNGEMAAFYNAIAFVAAFIMVPVSRRLGPATLHGVCLCFGGASMLLLPSVESKAMLFVTVVGVGIAWASIMGNPYVILASVIPPGRTGVYMGIFNMMIVLPMIFLALTLPWFYEPLLGGDPRNVLRMAGVLLFCAATAVWRVRKV